MFDFTATFRPPKPRASRRRAGLTALGALSVLTALLAAQLAAPQALAQGQTLSPGTVQTLGGTGEPGYVDGVKGYSQYNNPQGLALRKDGTLFIADTGNGAVRSMRPGETRATTFAKDLAMPVALVFDKSTNLFVANAGDSSIVKFDQFGNLRDTLRPALNGGPVTAMSIDDANYLYIAQLNGVVTRVSPAGAVDGTFSAPGAHEFRGVAISTEGEVFVSDSASQVIWRFVAAGAAPEQFAGTLNSPGTIDGERGIGRLNRPHQIAAGPGGSIVIADRGSQKIRAVNCEGIITTLYGIDPARWFTFEGPGVYPGWWDSSAEFAEVREPVGVAVDSVGTVFGTEVYYNLIRAGSDLRYPGCGATTATNPPIAVILTPNSGIFPNGTNITITSVDGVAFGPKVRLHYTRNGADPTTNDAPAAVINGSGLIAINDRIDLFDLKVRAFNVDVPGPVAQGLPTANSPVAVLISPNSGFFGEDVEVTVTSAKPGGFGPGVQIFYTLDRTEPDFTDQNAPVIEGLATLKLRGPVDLSVLRVRAYNNGIPGPVTAGLEPILPLPGLNPPSGYFLTNTTITITNAADTSGFFPSGTRLFYTRDGSEPSQSSPEIELEGGIGKIELASPVNLATVKFRAFLGNTPGAVVTGQQPDFVPPRISFGFETPQEASSDFVAAAGQRFIAPVTMTVPPGTTMYGLQFGLTITNLTGPVPAENYQLGFESMLMKKEEGIFYTIRPSTFIRKIVDITPRLIEGQVFFTTNITMVYSNLVVTNASQNLLAVGWFERRTETNLYNTKEQDLIRYSIPHDTLFESPRGKVVPGGYSFVLPPAARDGDTYQINIIRPSANSDGIRDDIFIEAPIGTDPEVKLAARQTVKIGERRYIVGDLAPFRWFNAGDFGDGSILNNDLEQIHQTVIYGINWPADGSDMEDSLDSCCVDTNGVDLASTFRSWDGNDQVINTIGFGDGRINIADLYVTFRRALDPSLAWYSRYWSNGIRRAVVVPNTFRGQATTLSASSFQSVPPPPPVDPNAPAPSVTFSVGGIHAVPGQLAEVPIYADVQGQYPIRTLLLNLKVKTIDGRAGITQSVSFNAHPLLGGPDYGGGGTSEGYGAAWIDPNHPGLSGRVLLGTLYVPIPQNAGPDSAYLIEIDRASATHNGLGIIPATTQDGVIIMRNRPNVGWNDGIPDQWRIQYFGTLANLKSASTADADEDGAPNAAEFKLGTNPIDPADNLRVRVLPQFGNRVTIKFRSVAGVKYKLEAADSLQPGAWTTIQTNILGTGGEVELSRDSGASHGFYRVSLQE